MDKRGFQRMEMCGIRGRGFFINKLLKALCGPNTPFKVANKYGDLEAYKVHFAEPKRFDVLRLKEFWNSTSDRMHELLPSACKAMVSALSAARVRDRLCARLAHDAISDDCLVNNVGVSAAYQSPPHFDESDMGWTYALAFKCIPKL